MGYQTVIVYHSPSGREPPQMLRAVAGELAAVENPVWAGLLASFARRRGLAVQILDAEAEGLAPAQVAERVREAGVADPKTW